MLFRSDLNLPDSTGLTTLARVRGAAPRVPVIVMTGSDDPALERKAIDQGAKDYLVKGQIEPSLLARVIQHCVSNQRASEVSPSLDWRGHPLFENALEPMLIADDEGVCAGGNSAAAELFSRTVRDLRNRPIGEIGRAHV